MGTGVLGWGVVGSLGSLWQRGTRCCQKLGVSVVQEGLGVLGGGEGGVGLGLWLCCGFRLSPIGASQLFASWGVPRCSLCRWDRSTWGCCYWRT